MPTTRFLQKADFTPSESWSLAAWCVAQGSDEFSINLVGLQGAPSPFCDAFVREMSPFAVGMAPRSVLYHLLGASSKPERLLWRATLQALEVIARYLPDGLFSYRTDHKEGWLEDPTFYRNEELFLGVVTHEGEGVLELTELEVRLASEAGFLTHDRGTWI